MEQPEGAETCGGCGLIFAKWKERHTPQEPAAPPESVSSEAAAPEQAPKPAPAPWPPPSAEPKYFEFPLKKLVLIFGPLLLGLAVLIFWPSKEEKHIPAALPRPIMLYGSATVYPTDTPEPNTPTPIYTPMTITGPSWVFHGKILDGLRLMPLGGVIIVFSNNGVAVTATTTANGLYQISVPPLSGIEAYEVQLSHPSCRESYWEGDPSNLSQEARLARAYEYPENDHLRGMVGGGGDKEVNFAMFPAQLTEQEVMWLRNARPRDQQ